MADLDEPIALSACDDGSPRRLAAALPVTPGRVGHIGGTAVPGLPAKPTIDLTLGLDAMPPPALAATLASLGYQSQRRRHGRPPAHRARRARRRARAKRGTVEASMAEGPRTALVERQVLHADRVSGAGCAAGLPDNFAPPKCPNGNRHALMAAIQRHRPRPGARSVTSRRPFAPV
ncbi:GrpB family protein [Phreatobacter sp. AB_2022a]|uniref:GrpB family protein n=1 Tax=Phreatobacter sp. AB_2022a TaxID=3003134 RepID=UPI002287182B|nr:GrpB family protein [Phreatobacter sp. AB_2022a]MCZ0732923.1 GrpB family protein [Phreatobacter sp. AB_2022a]